nr:hypothetical protein [Bradyrhizobium diazoefficiens]
MLQLNGLLGCHRRQWMFVLEALPAAMLGKAAFFVSDRPKSPG